MAWLGPRECGGRDLRRHGAARGPWRRASGADAAVRRRARPWRCRIRQQHSAGRDRLVPGPRTVVTPLGFRGAWAGAFNATAWVPVAGRWAPRFARCPPFGRSRPSASTTVPRSPPSRISRATARRRSPPDVTGAIPRHARYSVPAPRKAARFEAGATVPAITAPSARRADRAVARSRSSLRAWPGGVARSGVAPCRSGSRRPPPSAPWRRAGRIAGSRS